MALTANQNLLSPNKFRLAIARFPNIEFFAQSAPIPGFTTGSVYIPTGAPNDYYEIGDKIRFNDFKVSFILDVNMQTFQEVLSWSNMAMVSKRGAGFNPYSDITVVPLDNQSNANLLFTIHNAFPSDMSDVDLSVKKSEDAPITMDVLFKYSHYTIGSQDLLGNPK